ncbi:MAG: thioredoxin-like domain-containing protein [Cruoricaptor ignavus]|nr:thioredoxin-like domain-containing protein [Cruoricaptor ignavus]
MKKYLLLILLAIFAVSCSKKVEIKGKIAGGSPLERLEIIEASGVGTLPLVNLAVDKDGNFSGNFEAPKNGLYVISYAGKNNMIYLKKGQELNISGKSENFPQEYTITGDAKANNDFLKESQKAFENYASKINIQELLTKDEAAFITQFNKIQTEVSGIFKDNAKKLNADDDVLKYKEEETTARLMGLLDAYEEQHGMLTAKPAFKVSEKFKELRKKLEKNDDRMIRNYPMYRDYKLNKLNGEFQKYASTLPQNDKEQPMISEVFANFLKTQKNLSQTAKDYLYAYVLAQSDLNFNNAKNYDKLTKLIDNNISNSEIKSELKELQKTLMGFKAGTTPQMKLMSANGETKYLGQLKGKPTLVTFYASWNPTIAISTTPILKEVAEFYKAKMNFAYVDLDDTKEQFLKTSSSLFKGFPGEQYWIEGGINSSVARKFGLYGFKTPSFIILDANGKLYGRPFFNLGDPELVQTLEKLTGIKAPDAPEHDIQLDLMEEDHSGHNHEEHTTVDSASAK